MQIFGTVIQGLGAALDLLQARHNVLAENVANAETPGYRARDLDFGNVLAAAFDPTTPESGAPQSATPEVQPSVDRNATVKLDGNSVDLDMQMGELSENAFKIVALSQLLSRKLDGLKRVIDGGRA
jgi:flagellar basal-body rod protein FlgB